MIHYVDLPADLQWLKQYTNRNYYEALWSTLVQIRPVNCLEIGTFRYYSAKVFSRYFDEYAPDGKLITVDIATWNRDTVPPKRVYPVMVYPHRKDIDQFHGGIKLHYKNYLKVLQSKKPTHVLNLLAIHEKMVELNIPLFDFFFIDGGHDEVSVRADFIMAKILTAPTGYILIDDITDNRHDVYKVVQRLLCDKYIYYYNDWHPNPNMGLIEERYFSLEDKLALCQ
jgi:hypothetical protein